MRLLVTGLLLLASLAGCVGDDDEGPDVGQGLETARLACIPIEEVAQPPQSPADATEVCNLWSTVDPWEREANELSVAVNPTDPQNIVATGKDYNPADAGDCVWDGIYVTNDGGRMWESRNLEGSNWRWYGSGDVPGTPDPEGTPSVHPEFGRFWCATDPVVEFGPDGTLYWTVMPYQCDAASGSKIGRDVLPQGGLNDWMWTCVSMYVLVSEDGGATFPVVREVAFGERLVHDRQWIAASEEHVLLCWRYGGSGMVDAADDGRLPPEGGMVCSVSDDKGRSWSDFEVVPGGFMSSPWAAYGPDGSAWLAGNGGGGITVVRSPDGGTTWDAQVLIPGSDITNPPGGGEHGRSVLHGNTFRLPAYPSIDVDTSGGPYDGRVYVTWRTHTDGSDADSDVYVAWSDDGVDWSEPAIVSDPAHTDGVDQFMPALAVGADGTVDLVFYDQRNDPEDLLFDLYHTYSTDGGRNWSADLRVSDSSSDEQYSHHQNGMVFLGDYIDIDGGDGFAVPVWVDTRHGKADAFVAVIERPGVPAPGT